jgi:hypothetical protein
MAKKSSQRKGIIEYLLFTVVILLVTVSLLSLFVFKYTNLVSDHVLGARTESLPSNTLLCGTCHGVIILQKDGTNSKNWGAKCVTKDAFKNLTYVAYLICPVPTLMPRPTSGPMPIISSHPERTSR